jgi:hypothetical protein
MVVVWGRVSVIYLVLLLSDVHHSLLLQVLLVSYSLSVRYLQSSDCDTVLVDPPMAY